MELLKFRGRGLQRSGRPLFSSDGDESTPDRPPLSSAVSETPTAGGARTSDDLGLRDELVRLRRDLDEERARRADSGVSGAALKEIFDAQAKTFATAIRGSTDKRSSAIRIQPTFKPPILGDEGKSSRDIKEFFDKFDDMCNLANDGKGMLPQERLQTLSTCLKGD